MSNAVHSFRGFTIEKSRVTGYWLGCGSDREGYRVQLTADTLAGMRGLIREALAR